MNEKIIDDELDDFLKNSTLPDAKVAGSAIDGDEFSEEEEPVKDSTPAQREYIFQLLRSHGFLPQDPHKVIILMNSLKKLNYEDCEAYVEALSCIKAQQFSRELTIKLVTGFNNILIHPADQDTRKAILEDQILMGEMDNVMGYIFSKLGKLRLLMMYGIYCGNSIIQCRRKGLYKNVVPEQV